MNKILGINITHTVKLIILNSMVPKQNFKVKIHKDTPCLGFFSPWYTCKWFCIWILPVLNLQADNEGKKSKYKTVANISLYTVFFPQNYKEVYICNMWSEIQIREGTHGNFLEKFPVIVRTTLLKKNCKWIFNTIHFDVSSLYIFKSTMKTFTSNTYLPPSGHWVFTNTPLSNR